MARPTVIRHGAVAIRVSDDPAGDIARSLAVRIRSAIKRRGAASLAVSGGSTAPSMLAALVHEELDWDRLTLWQVDERVAPDGDDDRNAGQLWFMPCETRLMPVTDADLSAASERYADALPERLDAVHLGLGGDGHTASWPPAPHPDADVAARPRAVEVIGVFNGRQRMTLTARPINGARSRLVLTTGASKAAVVRGFLERNAELPISQVHRSGTTLFVDADAAAQLSF